MRPKSYYYGEQNYMTDDPDLFVLDKKLKEFIDMPEVVTLGIAH